MTSVQNFEDYITEPYDRPQLSENLEATPEKKVGADKKVHF